MSDDVRAPGSADAYQQMEAAMLRQLLHADHPRNGAEMLDHLG